MRHPHCMPPLLPGVPFRETHHISGAAVKMAEDRGCELSDLTVADLATIHPLFADDVTEVCVHMLAWPVCRGQGSRGCWASWVASARSGVPAAAWHARLLCDPRGAALGVQCGLLSEAAAEPAAPVPSPWPQVWDFQRSAEMRDTEGGASRRSVLEQVAKLRAYLAKQA